MAITLSIAEVSGLIAAAVMIIQYILPAALVVILVKYIGSENKAVTWSVVNRTIGTSIWPHLVRADSVATKSTPLSARLPHWMLTFSAALLVLASVLAPLGLYEEIRPSKGLTSIPFRYVKDPGPWGRVTMPRPNAAFSRRCESGLIINCPGQYQGVYMNETSPGTFESVATDENSTLNTTIPANITAIFSSATADMGNTLSGLFDIQYRRWKFKQDDITDFGRPYVEGDSRFIGSMINEDALLLVEGLVVDMRNNPGIGFRNHTIPVGLEHGGIWDEDVTWIEPVTECADTNLTLEMTREDSELTFADNITFAVVDGGAFVDLDETVLESPAWIDNQTLDLFGRAHKAARMQNVFVASSLNISLPLKDNATSADAVDMGEDGGDAPPFIWSAQDFEMVLQGDLAGIGGTPMKVPARYDVNSTIPFVNHYPTGEKKLLALNYTAITQICRGYYEVGNSELDRRGNNLTYPGVQCAYVLGASLQSPVTNTSIESYTGRDKLQRKLYVCASGVRASIKTASFRYNGTGNEFSNLAVLDVKDKTYPPDDPEAIPLWASEHSFDRRMRWDPLWGLVSNEHEKTTNSYESGIYTHRAKTFWLPVSPHMFSNFGEVEGYDSLAAASGFMRRLGHLYDAASPISGLPDYSGKYDYAMLERFQRLSADQKLVGNIPSLIMTDILAGALVGTKKATSQKYVTWPATLSVDEDDDSEGVLPRAKVHVYERVIRYDLRYAIPGFVVLAILLGALFWALVIMTVASPNGSFFGTLRNVYNQTSTGRLATGLLLRPKHDINPRQSTQEWVKSEGQTILRFDRVASSGGAQTTALLSTPGKPQNDPVCEIVGGSPAPSSSSPGGADGTPQTVIRVQTK